MEALARGIIMPFIFIHSSNDIVGHLKNVDGVMIGRAAYANPCLLTYFDSLLLENLNETELKITPNILTRREVIHKYVDTLKIQEEVPVNIVVAPLMNFFHGTAGTKQWRLLFLPFI